MSPLPKKVLDGETTVVEIRKQISAMRLMQTMWMLSIVMAFLMLAGLYKPWLLLWWRATQTRLDVIKFYGGGAAITYFVYWMLKFYT